MSTTTLAPIFATKSPHLWIRGKRNSSFYSLAVGQNHGFQRHGRGFPRQRVRSDSSSIASPSSWRIRVGDNHSWSFDMHIENEMKKKNRSPQKNGFCRGGGGLRTLQTGPQLIDFFFLSAMLTIPICHNIILRIKYNLYKYIIAYLLFITILITFN